MRLLIILGLIFLLSNTGCGSVMSGTPFKALPFLPTIKPPPYFSEQERKEILANKWRSFGGAPYKKEGANQTK